MQGFEDINRVSWDWVLSCGSEDKGSYIPANFWDVSQSAANHRLPPVQTGTYLEPGSLCYQTQPSFVLSSLQAIFLH